MAGRAVVWFKGSGSLILTMERTGAVVLVLPLAMASIFQTA